MRAKVIRSYTDKYTMKSIDRGTEIEITEERFSELSTGPLGVFVEEIKEEPPINEDSKKVPTVEDNSTESQKDIENPKEESGNKEKKKSKSKTAEK